MTAAIKSGWRSFLRGRQGLYCLTLTAGIILYAIILPISYTVLPAIMKELRAEPYYAWVATVFALGSFLGACLLSHCLRLLPPHLAYIGALLLFAFCTLACAYAPSLAFLLSARLLQGLSGGLLVALTYHMLNTGLPPQLLPRGIGLISAMWGVATLIGPYFGGRFENWRIPFFAVSCITLLFCVFAFFIFGKTAPARCQSRQEEPPSKTPMPQIALLTALVVIISLGSVPEAWQPLMRVIDSLAGLGAQTAVSPLAANSAALLAGLALLLLLAFAERRSKNRILPKATFTAASPFLPIYAIIIFNMIALGATKLYLPLFLQNLHQAGSISAGYIAFIDSIGWSLGAFIGAALNTAAGGESEAKQAFYQKSRFGRAAVFIAAPFLCFAGMGVMLLFIPVSSHSDAVLFIIGAAFFITGFFSGIFWPHILAYVLRQAGAKEQAAAGSSIVTVQLFAGALADCVGGAVVNAAGFSAASNAALAHSAAILFSFCLILLLAVCFFCLKVKNNIARAA